jgi:hypothetical protein
MMAISSIIPSQSTADERQKRMASYVIQGAIDVLAAKTMSSPD